MKPLQPHPHPNLSPEGEGDSLYHLKREKLFPSPSGGGAPKRGAGAPILGMQPWRRTEARELSRRCIPLRGRIHRPKPTEPAPPSAGAGWGGLIGETIKRRNNSGLF